MRSKGFTLLELMVAIVIAGILITIGIQSMSTFTVKMRVDNEISDLNRIILVARNHAATNGQNVTVCPLTSNSCTSNSHNEVSAFIDLDNDKTFDASDNETLIQVKSAMTSFDQLTYANNNTGLTYSPERVLTGVRNSTFFYCPKGYAEFARGIVVSLLSRTRKTTDTHRDGIGNYGSSGNLSCPRFLKVTDL